VSECGSVEQCRGSVGAVSGQCRLTLVSECRAVSEQFRSSVGQCRGFLTVGIHGQCRISVEQCRSVEVSECQSVEQCRSVGVSECRSVVGVSGGCQVGDSVKPVGWSDGRGYGSVCWFF